MGPHSSLLFLDDSTDVYVTHEKSRQSFYRQQKDTFFSPLCKKPKLRAVKMLRTKQLLSLTVSCKKRNLGIFLEETNRVGDNIVISLLGHNEFDFFQKMKKTDPLMGAKLKSKTHLPKKFLFRFLHIWLQSFQKVLIWPQTIFLAKNPKRY